VRGQITQINPGPVVTTFEYKPEAGIKYSRITNLTDDLCLALKAESILIERMAGKSTVGIQVPNREREIIWLRENIESSEFIGTKSKLTLALGKRSEEHTSELQSPYDLVCRLLLEKKKKTKRQITRQQRISCSETNRSTSA